jgi:hypothetical protein
MTNEELIDYCDRHCESSQALFSGRDVNRMMVLAGHLDGFLRVPDDQWLSMHKPMRNLCDSARARARAACVQLKAEPIIEDDNAILWIRGVQANSDGTFPTCATTPSGRRLRFSGVVEYGPGRLTATMEAETIERTAKHLLEHYQSLIPDMLARPVVGDWLRGFGIGEPDEVESSSPER